MGPVMADEHGSSQHIFFNSPSFPKDDPARVEPLQKKGPDGTFNKV